MIILTFSQLRLAMSIKYKLRTSIVKVIAPSEFSTTLSATDALNTVFPRTGLAAANITGLSYFTNESLDPKKRHNQK